MKERSQRFRRDEAPWAGLVGIVGVRHGSCKSSGWSCNGVDKKVGEWKGKKQKLSKRLELL